MPRLLLSVVLASVAVAAQAPRGIPVMLLDGESAGRYHDWPRVTAALKAMLDETGLFAVTVVTAPPAGGDFSAFDPQFAKYQAVVMNYDAPDDRWPAALKTSFERYMTNGGGLVAVHAADNAFAGWRAFNEMTGVGGWRARNEQAGPYWFFRDGKLASDPSPGPAGSHGRRTPFQVTVRDAEPSDHAGAAAGVDAPGRRALRAAARPGQEHDRAGHRVLGPGEQRQRPRRAAADGAAATARGGCSIRRWATTSSR